MIHTAGLSQQMDPPLALLKVNELGAINIVQAFYEVAGEGFVLVNVASMSTYMLPNFMIPTRRYKHAFSDPDELLLFRTKFFPK